MMDCEKAQELISQLLDGELTAEDERAIREHIARCGECRTVYEAFAAVSDAMRAEAAEVPATLHESIMSGVRAAKKKKPGLLIRLRPYAAVAACLAVVLGTALALGRGVGFDNTSSTAAGAAPVAAADQQRSADTDAEAQQKESAPTENGAGVQSSLDKSEAEENAPAAFADDAVYGGAEILSARLVREDGETEISDLDGLAELLSEQPAEGGEGVSIPYGDTGWVLYLETAGGSRELRLFFDGESVYVTAEDGVSYLAAGTAGEFSEIK